jgi:hypothetical protein
MGRPVFAESARENVLFPAPAMPVTTTRRPTEIAPEISLIQTEGPYIVYPTPAHNAVQVRFALESAAADLATARDPAIGRSEPHTGQTLPDAALARKPDTPSGEDDEAQIVGSASRARSSSTRLSQRSFRFSMTASCSFAAVTAFAWSGEDAAICCWQRW